MKRLKNIDRKNLIIFTLCLVLLGGGLFYLYGYKIALLIDQWKYQQYQADQDQRNSDEAATGTDTYGHPEADIAHAAYSCDGLYFYGDIGYLTKGALLDQSVASAYRNLPDTIHIIRYGEQIHQYEPTAGDFYERKARFSPIPFRENSKLLVSGKWSVNDELTVYLKMAEQGQVEFLRFLPNGQGRLEVEDECDFRSRYGNYFAPHIAWQRDTPLAIKEALVEYLKSGEGSNYTFVNDRRQIDETHHMGTFTGVNTHTGKSNQELAIVLTEKNSTGNHNERIVVVAYDQQHRKGYILYNEIFYNNKLLIKVYGSPNTLPEEAKSLAKFVHPTQQLIEVKIDSGASIYLYYVDEFDTMRRRMFWDAAEEDSRHFDSVIGSLSRPQGPLYSPSA
ncbi:hypothetical protein H8B06_02280 [Sphingobacterium sp. DN00404]|uniref:Uncharacterized protein n=1 Tax=Sphingobacterium micropteri TaxID=2763501 RepID=A0ABR7YK10_9SPHI|nr:hypothetical protein [Sphingobacterium micropteri]MBD1431639.1 hypothetical protein [Sphingobacterium micropteri]